MTRSGAFDTTYSGTPADSTTSSWHAATVVGTQRLNTSARALTLSVPGFVAPLPGQHVDLRLTAPDGYQATRSYSLAESGTPERVDLIVDRVPDGEVSPYLVDVAQPGDRMEVRGPLGGFFVWREENPRPVLLVAGGSGVVPLLAMLRARRASSSAAPFHLVYSVRTPDATIARAEIEMPIDGAEVSWVFTREAPADGRPHRLSAEDLVSPGFTAADGPDVFVCGPTGFVEAAARLLTELGHDSGHVRTERFGGA